MIETDSLFDYHITHGNETELVDRIVSLKLQNKFSHITTINPHIIIGSENNLITKNWVIESDIIIADSVGIKWAFSLLKKKSITVLTGIGLVYQLFKRKNLRFYFVGGTDKTIKKAVQKTQKKYENVSIVGYNHGFFNEFDISQVINKIIKAKPDFILVGMGFPKQEYFIQTLSQYCNHGVAIGVGGVFDILSGNKKRAPKWIQKRGCEWIFRVIQEPKRIFRLKPLLLYILYTIQYFFAGTKQVSESVRDRDFN